jgi:transposase
MKMDNTSTNTAGIDVGKEWLDGAVAGTPRTRRCANTPDGHREMVAWLRQQGALRVGLEASGGYERAAVAHLRKQGIDVVVFQPMQVRAYARFLNRKAKTDTLDAQMIARCMAAAGEKHDPPDPRLTDLSESMTFLEQVEEDLVRLKTRLEGFTNPAIRRRIAQYIQTMKRRRAATLKAFLAAIAIHPDLDARFHLILSVPGIGPRTALALLVRMPELGQLSREQAASLAGVAPFDRQSGKFDGNRHIAGGRARLRRSLYAAALPAAFQHNPALINLYQRLIKAGKSHKTTLIACVRKLIIFANTVVARGTPWTTIPAKF